MTLPIELIRNIVQYNKEYWMSVTNSTTTTVSFILLKNIHTFAVRKPVVSTTPLQQDLCQILDLEIPSPTKKCIVMFYRRWYLNDEYYESKRILKKQYDNKMCFRNANEIFNYF